MAVRIEQKAFGDARFAALGDLCGYNRHEALGRMAQLWDYCTERNTYVAPESIIRGCLGPNGVEALIDADLGERIEQGIRVRGTSGRVEWLETARTGAQLGGESRAATAVRGPDGRMLPRQNGDSTQRNPAESPAGGQLDQPAGSSRPAPSSPLALVLVDVLVLEGGSQERTLTVEALNKALEDAWKWSIPPKWYPGFSKLAPFSPAELRAARLAVARTVADEGGKPNPGLLLRKLEDGRKPVRSRSLPPDQAPPPPRKRSTYKPPSDSDREAMSPETRAMVDNLKAKMSLGSSA